jgi:hypothetical protein
MSSKDKNKDKNSAVTVNKKAYHDFEFIEQIEAGISLTGSEVKSLRNGSADLSGSYARINDDECFYNADPNGFFVGLLDGEPISSISAVQYGNDFGFIGFYIVKPEYRSRGYGLKIWNHGMDYLKGRNIALDGVFDQQENYKKSGFKLAYSNLRYEGKAKKYSNEQAKNIRDIKSGDFANIIKYDSKYFPVQREKFLDCWLNMSEAKVFIYESNNEILGFSQVRKCRTGFKIGPLFAENYKIAEELFLKMNNSIPNGEFIYLDIPEVNQNALELVQKYSMQKVFGTARMYTGNIPEIDNNKVYGVTTFELG